MSARVLALKFCSAVVFASVLTSAAAWASPFDEARPETIVKITSQPCRGYPVYNGTGGLFTVHNQVYVLTSDHVFLHGNNKICHTVANSAIGEEKAQYFAADWSTGLGVLSVPALKASAKQRSFDSFAKTDLVTPSALFSLGHLLTIGYPAESDTLVSSFRGDLAGTVSSAKIFFKRFDLIEAKNAHGEFGMSGGPVFVGQHSQYAGVLSHQILRQTNEKEREAASWDASREVENNLLVIPQTVVGPWLEKLFSPQAQGFSLFEDASQQLNQGHNAVTLENLHLSLSCNNFGPYGKKGCSVAVDLANRDQFAKFGDVNGTLTRIYDYYRLNPRGSMHIGEFYQNLGVGEARKRQSFKSLLEFLRLLQDPAWLPYIDVSATQRTDLVEKRLDEFYYQLAQWQSGYGQRSGPWPQGRIDRALYQIAEALEPVGYGSRPDRHDQISHRDLVELLTNSDYGGDWAVFEKNHSGTAVLKKLLNELADYYVLLSL